MPSSSEPIMSARRPSPGFQPPMMTSCCLTFLTLIQSRRWSGWYVEVSPVVQQVEHVDLDRRGADQRLLRPQDVHARLQQAEIGALAGRDGPRQA